MLDQMPDRPADQPNVVKLGPAPLVHRSERFLDMEEVRGSIPLWGTVREKRKSFHPYIMGREGVDKPTDVHTS